MEDGDKVNISLNLKMDLQYLIWLQATCWTGVMGGNFCAAISVWKGWQWKQALGTLAAKSYQLSWALFEPGFLSASSSGASSSGTSTPSSASSSFGIKLRDIIECMFLTIKMRPSRRARREGSGNSHRRCFTRCAKLAWLHWHCLTRCHQKWNDAMMMSR